MREDRLLLSALALLLSACSEQEGFDCETPAPISSVGFLGIDTSPTPRPNLAAEVLALEASGEFIAPTWLYDRVFQELGTLQAGWPDQVHTHVLGCGVPTDVMLGFTEAGAAQVSSGQYSAWDEYNEALRLVDLNSYFDGKFVRLRFQGIYNLAAVAQAYSRLREVESAEPNGYAGDGADVCLERRRGTHLYIFYTGEGDCPSGCGNKHYEGFTVDSRGAVTYLGSHDRGGAEPEWYADALQCRAFLHGFHGL